MELPGGYTVAILTKVPDFECPDRALSIRPWDTPKNFLEEKYFQKQMVMKFVEDADKIPSPHLPLISMGVENSGFWQISSSAFRG